MKKNLSFLIISLLSAAPLAAEPAQDKKISPVTVDISVETPKQPTDKQTVAKAHHSTAPETQITLSPQEIQDIYSVILKNFDYLESTIDSIGQNLASGASRLSNTQKDAAQQQLRAIRMQLEAIKQATAQHTDLQALCVLASVTREMIYTLQQAVDNKLLLFPTRTQKQFNAQLGALQNNTLRNLGLLLQENEQALKKLNQDVDIIGLSKTNQVYRKFRAFAKKYSLYDVAEHALVYTAFVAWCAHITPASGIDELIGQTTDGQPVYDPQTQKLLTPGLFSRSLGKTFRFFQNITGQKPYSSRREITKYTYEKTPEGHKRTLEQSFSHDEKTGSTLQTVGDNIVRLNVTPILDIPVGAAFLSYFTRDAKRLYAQYEKIREFIDNRLYGTAKQVDFAESTIPKERFKDIVGREEIKAELSKIIEYIVHPDRYNRANIRISRGYLLAGSPQTGKTFMAKALSGEISDALEATGKDQKVRFFEISTDNLKKHGIYYYIDLAKNFAPCILFFDELDLARLQRDGDSGLLSEFLQCMSVGLSNDEKDQVFILGVTNKPSNLDFALLQPGRFGKVIYFEKPTFQHRIDYFKNECQKRCMNMNNFDFNYLAQLTEGCHFGALKDVMCTACMTAKMEGSAVTQTHFERAIDSEVRKMIVGAPAIPENKEHLIAIHQAGKALASILLQPDHALCQITVLPVTQEVEEEHVSQQYAWDKDKHAPRADRLVHYGEMFSCHTQDSLNMVSQKELHKQCQILHAGNVAQLLAGLDQCIDQNDRKQAFTIAKQIVLGGLEARDLSKNTAEEKLTEATALFVAAEKEVTVLLTPHVATIKRIAQELQKHKTLSAAQVKALL